MINTGNPEYGNNPIDQFIQGQRDCREGLPAKSQDEAYINGYSFQYQVMKTLEAPKWAK